eukprot:15467570-Alexandrium_andersonii.AAC.1
MRGEILIAPISKSCCTVARKGLPYIDPNTNKPNSVRHALRNRQHDVAKERYTKSIIANGVAPGVRGIP